MPSEGGPNLSCVGSSAVRVDLHAREEAAAWFEYLKATREAEQGYREIEPWAWARLLTRLRSLDARRGFREAGASRANGAGTLPLVDGTADSRSS